MSGDDRWASPWSCDAFRSMHLSLVRSKAATEQLDPEERETALASFQPLFVHQLFGESEVVYGYRKLNIELKFASGSLATYLNIDYAQKMPASEGNEPDDIENKLYKVLPADYLKNQDSFQKRVQHDEQHFQPVGTRIGGFGRKRNPAFNKDQAGKGKEAAAAAAQDDDGDDEEDEEEWEECEAQDPDAEVIYEAWAAKLDTPGFKDLHRRMQLFVLLMIEVGSFIEEDDPKWEFVVLYEKRKMPGQENKWTYHFIGFTSLYQFLYFPDKTRLRLSQFVILPPYQGQGHGGHLYSMVYLWCLTRSDVAELCIEDPIEAFDEMRDKSDLRTILAQPALGELLQTLPLDKTMLDEIRTALKLDRRQFARLIEMAALLKLGIEEASQNKEFRLMVKERLYRHNADTLKQIEPAERKTKLSEAFESVVEGYKRTLASLLGGDDEKDEEEEGAALDTIQEES